MPTPPKSPGFRDQAIDWLRGLNDKQFAEFFYGPVATRNTSDVPRWRGQFVLADTELVDNEPWKVVLIALPVKPDCANWSDESNLSESCTCDDCGAAARSWSKRVECPVCKTEVYCT